MMLGNGRFICVPISLAHHLVRRATAMRIKQALMAGLVLVPGLILGQVATNALHKPSKTYAQYIREIVNSNTLDEVGRAGAEQVRSTGGWSASEFDSHSFASALSACLRSDMTQWLASDDPMLAMTVTKADVPALANRFVVGCADKMGN
jgi:hypothetical protein